MHENSYSKIEWFKNSYLSSKDYLEILDVGSFDKYGHYNCRDIFNYPNWNYMGLDFKKGKNVDIIVEDVYNWDGILSDSFDVVVSCFFFENVKFFWKTMGEIKRIIKPGGYICIIVSSTDLNLEEATSYNNFQIEELIKLMKYFDFDIIHNSIDEYNEIKQDICIIAINNFENDDLKLKLDNIENKINAFLNFKQMIKSFELDNFEKEV